MKKQQTVSMVLYELERVLPQLLAVNYSVRSSINELREDINTNKADIEKISAELFVNEQLEIVADDLLESLHSTLEALKNSEDSTDE